MAPLSESPTAIGYVRGLLGGADRATAEAVVDELDRALPIGWDDLDAVEAVLSQDDTTDGRALLDELWGADLDRRLGAIADRAGAESDDVAAVAHRLVLLIGHTGDEQGDEATTAADSATTSEGDDDSSGDDEQGRRGGRRGLRRLFGGRSE